MNIKILLIISLLLVNLPNKNIKDEVELKTTSSFIFQSGELSKGYLEAKKLYDTNNFAKSLQLSLNLLKNYNTEHVNNTEEILLLKHLIANIYYATRNNENALLYYNQTLQSLNEIKKFIDNIKAPIHSDINYIKSESLLKYGNTFSRLNIINNNNSYRDSAIYYYKVIDSINSNSDKVLEIKSKAYNNLSVIYLRDSLYEKSKYFVLKSINTQKKLNNKVSTAGALGNLSSIYLSEGNFTEAKRIYFQALDIIRNVNTNEALKVREDLYYNLAYNLYKLKDYKAYDYQELSYILKDSLREKEVRAIIAEITEKWNFDVKKQLLLKEEENKRLKAQKTFLFIGIVAFIVIVSLLYGLNFYKLKQKNLRLKLSQTQLLQSQKIEKIKSDSQTRILNATIDGKESERKQIAETLHDSVSALLSSANLHLQATKSQFNGNAPIEIDKTSNIITEASQKIRDLSHTLVSSVLLKFGLKFAILDMADKYSNSQIAIETNIGRVGRYHQSFEIKMYNIIQEFINNILKHSKASEAVVSLEEKEGKLHLKIVDNGVGFDKTKITQKDGLGINQIDARIRIMNGFFHIDSTKDKGTKIEVELPIVEKEAPNHV
ncbi:tetratricopeptide repeat-containing sensor histidine kinase [uncultured Polaribacter sp.]|uniref:tetratricopeptide repeat-containing sensor histidine kinase n=1 Tax=uncultured Polaribacter sp. TaxID=174711 RepID=UPI0026240888|nr:tetratricopeptide repeat-containing sensor histidine kinase [uncultured Polaribacter sp.]